MGQFKLTHYREVDEARRPRHSEMGYMVVEVWDHEIFTTPWLVVERIRRARRTAGGPITIPETAVSIESHLFLLARYRALSSRQTGLHQLFDETDRQPLIAWDWTEPLARLHSEGC